MTAGADEPLNRPASPGALFRVFTRMAMQGFGGVLPVARRELVDRERWLTDAQFVELLSVGQVLPGPNVVNLSLVFGDRCFGWRGAVAALAGMLTLPLLIVVALAAAYRGLADVPAVAGALRGMGAVAAGMVLAMAWQTGQSLKGNALGAMGGLVLGGAAFTAIAVLRWPLVWVLPPLALLAYGWAWWALAPGRRGGTDAP